MHLSQPTPCHRAPRGTDLRPGAAVAEGAPAGRMRGPGRVVRGLKVAARTGRGLGLVVLGACGSGSGTAPGGGGGTAVAPSITAQPASASVVAGSTASFSVTASGTAPLSYQWREGGTNISGATSASYTTPATSSDNNGEQFSVVVTNSAGSVTSSNATLTVTTAAVAPNITTQPANATVTAGQTATFSVTASGTAPLSYQWRRNGTSISGATSASYTTPAATSGDNGALFSVVVTNSAGSVTSSNATLTVTTGGSANLNLSVLNGTNGFRFPGAEPGVYAGYSVSAAGDINGDGIGDFIVGSVDQTVGSTDAGRVYVVFGKASSFGADFDPWSLNGTNGFRITGAALGGKLGNSVAAAGDINGDGFDDLIVGAPAANQNGEAYVVFGKASGFAPTLSLASLNGANGFRIVGATPGEQLGGSVSGAGDVNSDGIADVIVGASEASPNGSFSGAAYVVFGKASGFPASFNVSNLNGSNGFRIAGESSGNRAGNAVSRAGDVNGDGIADVIVGASEASPNGAAAAGAAYVIFGKAGGGLPATLNVSSLNGTNGFKLSGAAAGDRAGFSVSGVGDINGDKIADLVVGAMRADPNGGDSGAAYVVFGKVGAFAASLNLASLNGSNGFRIIGAAAGDQAGYSVSGTGDVNGDGIGDLIVGARFANGNAGAAYVVFGKTGAFDANLNLSGLNGSSGFRLSGVAADDTAGYSVSGSVDINGDKIPDVIVGAPGADANGTNSGAAYVVFGKK